MQPLRKPTSSTPSQVKQLDSMCHNTAIGDSSIRGLLGREADRTEGKRFCYSVLVHTGMQRLACVDETQYVASTIPYRTCLVARPIAFQEPHVSSLISD